MKDKIVNTGRRMERIVDISPRKPGVDPEFVAKALGAEIVPFKDLPERLKPAVLAAKAFHHR